MRWSWTLLAKLFKLGPTKNSSIKFVHKWEQRVNELQMNHLTKTSASEVIPLKGLSGIYIGKHVPFIMSVLTATAI
jgi:hypothetical protein